MHRGVNWQLHTLANVATTAGKHSTLTVALPEGVTAQLRHHPKDAAGGNCTAITFLGHEAQALSQNTFSISLDSIAFGQARSVVVGLTYPPGRKLPPHHNCCQTLPRALTPTRFLRLATHASVSPHSRCSEFRI